MRQTIGLLIATISFISFIFFIRLFVDEIQAINGHKEIITNSVDLSITESIKPLTIVDQNGTIYSEEYVEWRKPLAFGNIPTIVKQIFFICYKVSRLLIYLALNSQKDTAAAAATFSESTP